MQFPQIVLLLIGGSALGLVSCVVFVFCVVATIDTSGSAEDWGAAIFFVFFSFCGGIFGAVVGLVLSLRWISDHGSKPWTPSNWIGVLLGLAIGLVIRASNVLGFLSLGTLGDLIELRLGLAIFLAAVGCLGGIVGGFARPQRRR